MTSRVEILSLQESPALVEKWRECVTKTDNFRAWMQTPEWLDFHWRPNAKTYLAALRDGRSDDPFAVTPLAEKACPLQFSIAGRMLGNIHINGLLLIGNVPLFPASDEHYEALIDAALAVPSVDCLYMLGVPKTSPFWTFLAKAQETHPEWLFYTPGSPSYRYYFIDMSVSYDQYLSRHKSKTLQVFRRKLRLLEREFGGRLDLVRVREAGEVTEFLRAARVIAQKSWQHQLIEVDVDQEADRQGFLESMARQGILRSYVLMSGQKAIAFLVGFQLKGVFYFHETAYDPQYARYSPGLILLNLIVEDCFNVEKPNIFSFGMGEMPYKNFLANESGDEVTIMIMRNSAGSRIKLDAHRLFRKSIELVKSGLTRSKEIVLRRREAT